MSILFRDSGCWILAAGNNQNPANQNQAPAPCSIIIPPKNHLNRVKNKGRIIRCRTMVNAGVRFRSDDGLLFLHYLRYSVRGDFTILVSFAATFYEPDFLLILES